MPCRSLNFRILEGMKKFYLQEKLHLYILLTLVGCQSVKMTQQTIPLDRLVEETSGLASIENDLLTFNDSGGKASLYRHGLNGKIQTEYPIEGAINRDWEDIAQDDSLFYIADTGNNYATRKDLTIYLVNKSFNLVDSINVSYAKQTSFKRKKKNKFDAEALIAIDDSLVLFSKNRKSKKTQVYVFPKQGGKYVLNTRIRYDVNALITGGDYNSLSNQVVLTGYDFDYKQYVFVLDDFDLNALDQVKISRFQLPLENAQVEAVKILDNNTLWISSEGEGYNPPFLMQLNLKILNKSTP